MRIKLMLFLILISASSTMFAEISKVVEVSSSYGLFYGVVQSTSKISIGRNQYNSTVTVPSGAHLVFMSGGVVYDNDEYSGQINLTNEFVVESGAEFEARIGVMFEDPALEACIREEYNLKPNETILPATLLTIEKLECPSRGIESLSGIEFLQNLTELNVSENRIRNLEPLKALMSIETLDISYNLIEQLLPDKAVPSLNKLIANNNYITDLYLKDDEGEYKKTKGGDLIGYTMGTVGILKELYLKDNYLKEDVIGFHMFVTKHDFYQYKNIHGYAPDGYSSQEERSTNTELKDNLDAEMKLRLHRCLGITVQKTEFDKCNVFSLSDAESCYSCIKGKCPFDDLEKNCPSCSEELYCKEKNYSDGAGGYCETIGETRMVSCKDNQNFKKKQECIKVATLSGSYNGWDITGECGKSCFNMSKDRHKKYITPLNEMQTESHTCDNRDSGDSIWHKESPVDYTCVKYEQCFPLKSENRVVTRSVESDLWFAEDSLTGYRWHIAANVTNENNMKKITPLKFNFSGADAYCKSLQTEGFSSWRLPTFHELRSILDYKEHDPAVTNDLRGLVLSSLYWTSSLADRDDWQAIVGEDNEEDRRFKDFYATILFRSGENYILNESDSAPVICIESSETKVPISSSYANPRYLIKVENDGAIINLPEQILYLYSNVKVNHELYAVVDRFSGLMLEGAVVSGKSFAQAVNYCSDLNLLGFDDWRVPTVEELSSLINFHVNKLSGNSLHTKWATYHVPGDRYTRFPRIKSESLWTATQLVSSPESNWVVNFGTGKIGYKNSNNSARHVKCVRDYK